MELSTQDKWLIGGGITLAVAGTVILVVKNKKAAQEEKSADTPYIDATPTNTTNPIVKGGTTVKTTPIPAVVIPAEKEPARAADTERLFIGDSIMATGFNGTKTYGVKKNANGTYQSTGSVLATFKNGDKIGKIIWVGVKPDGTYRYVVQRDGAFLDLLYWVTDIRVVEKIGGKKTAIVPKGSTPSVTLDISKVLKKGSKGVEVKELQTKLGITADGDFGNNTENALFTVKKVKEIRLKDWK